MVVILLLLRMLLVFISLMIYLFLIFLIQLFYLLLIFVILLTWRLQMINIYCDSVEDALIIRTLLPEFIPDDLSIHFFIRR